ncbi:OmpA family protein [Oceanobacillus picturae]|uniref:OmpA family protein n=1 Tax=Oceanobacillus picturae TaxID=171693 RepID=UPI003643D8D7
MRKLFMVIVIVLLISGCVKEKDATSETKGEPDQTSEQENGTEATDTAQGEEEVDAEKAKSELGDLEVKLSGEAIIEEDQIRIEGESNLLPGSSIYSSGVTDGGFASSTFIDTAEVQEDGSFSFEFSGISTSTTVKLNLYTNNQTKEHYGENLEKATGPQVYVTDTHGAYEVKAEFYIDADQPMPYTIPIEIPQWQEKPDDYGEPEVWMEAEVDSDHEYLYFHGETNLVEGTRIGGNLRKDSGIIDAFSFGFTRINPDGTFELRVPYYKLQKGMYMPIRFEPKNNVWEDVLDTYGEHGEKLKGELVEKNGEDQYVELIVEIDAPDFDPPKDVGLTVEDEEVKIQMPDDLLFDFDESTLKADAKETLDDVMKDLQKLDENTEIHINGHTDNVGDPDYNLNLSKERAGAVWAYLEKSGDVTGLDVQIEGFGDTKPIASNKEEDGQERNRRVEIVINPK